MRRALCLAILLTLAVWASPGAVGAQFATPTVTLLSGADLGMPEYQIEVTDTAFVSDPEVQAGRILVTVTNSTKENVSQPFFIMIPEGDTLESLQTRVDAAAALILNGQMPEDGSDPLAFLFESYLAGGTSAPAGSSRQVIVELIPGDYAIADLDFLKQLVPLTVTGEMPSELPPVRANATLTAVDMGEAFDYTLTGTVSNGPQILEVVNASSQPHFSELTLLPEGFEVTEDLFGEMIMIDMGIATPNPNVSYPSTDDFLIYGFASLQSAGTTQWLITDFVPGTYSVTCWVPDPRYEGTPHSAMGMYTIFTVA